MHQTISFSKSIRELLTLTCLEHSDSEVREDVVRSFIDEAIENASPAEDEERDTRGGYMMYRLEGWFMDEIRKTIREKLSDALRNCRSDRI